MDIPTEWLSSQLVLGVILLVLAAVGVLFFFRVGAPGAPSAGDEGAGAGRDEHGHDGHDHDTAGPSGPGTYGPVTPVALTSVFETEPCWVSLLPGRGREAGDAPAPDDLATAGAVAPDGSVTTAGPVAPGRSAPAART